MIEADHDGRVTYRHVLSDLSGLTVARVVPASKPDRVLASGVIEPRFGAAALAYDPATRQLRELEGTWHLFTFEPPPSESVGSVHVAGDFNGWATDATPMHDRGDGVYRAMIRLKEGVYQYKFVLNGERWVNDPASDADYEEPDGHGGVNSAVLIGPDPRRLPPPPPEAIEPRAVLHDPDNPVDRSIASGSLVRLSLRVLAGDADHAAVHFRCAGEQWRREPLWFAGTHRGLDRFGRIVTCDNGRLVYFFELRDGSFTRYEAGGRLHETLDAARAAAYASSLTPPFDTPEWARHAVWYHVFPERFRNGEPANDPPGSLPWTADWWDALPGEVAEPGNFHRGAGNVWRRRFGGDLQGVMQQLPYLRRLGVNALYFNPVFEAESLHKYDATDHRHIDDNFGIVEQAHGTNNEEAHGSESVGFNGETDDPETWRWTPSDELFLQFIAEAHRQGFRVILDGVFNHVGREHFAFQDVLRHGRESRYADWFQITDWGDGGEPGAPGGIQWNAWDGPNGHLPEFRQDPELGLAPGPREHVFAVTRRWLAPDGDPSRGIDGWRLDVAGEVPHVFWRDWRKLVKSIKPDAYICGEIWGWAQPWLGGDQFDAVMNYPFAMAVIDFFADRHDAISPTAFAGRLHEIVHAYPLSVALVQQNLIDSHDTDRLASMFVNADRPYDRGNRLQDGADDYIIDKPTTEHWRRIRQALVCQMTFLGAPMIYYGSEAGMWGPDDPSNRMPMVWPDLMPYDDPDVAFREPLFEWYQRLIAMRHRLEPLRLGFVRTIIADDDRELFGYARDYEGGHVYVVFNRSEQTRRVEIPLADADHGALLIDWLDPDQTRVVVDPDAAPDARPRIEPIGIPDPPTAPRETITIELGPRESAVLSRVR